MEHARRLDALLERMREHELGLVLLFDRDDIRYFTGFR
ncbi:MAG: aminopeptidase P family N-terminal domain-containing protein, partial [Dehalococcoidia bacterium]|nr:aminopeptidase P family N-terminal domain-containing protein [Dehalococcoidia bacterium]